MPEPTPEPAVAVLAYFTKRDIQLMGIMYGLIRENFADSNGPFPTRMRQTATKHGFSPDDVPTLDEFTTFFRKIQLASGLK